MTKLKKIKHQEGFVYIVSYLNGQWLKIGKTSLDPHGRLSQLQLGGPEGCQLVHSEWSPNCDALEKLVHANLARFRKGPDCNSPGREFFKVTITCAIDTLKFAKEQIDSLGGNNPHEFDLSIEAILLQKSANPLKSLSLASGSESSKIKGLAKKCKTIVEELLLNKAEEDLNLSLLTSVSDVKQTILPMTGRMEAIFMKKDPKGYIHTLRQCIKEPIWLERLDPGSFAGQLRKSDHDELAAWLRSHNEPSLRLSIACNHAGAVLAGLHLQRSAQEHGYSVDLDYKHTAGYSLLLPAFTSDRPLFHAIIVGQPPFSIAQYTIHDAGMPMRTSYSLALPIHYEQQILLMSSKTRSNDKLHCVYVAANTVTEEPHMTGEFKQLLKRTGVDLRQSYETIPKSVNDFLSANVPIERKAAIQVWKPTYIKFLQKQGLVPVPGFHYKNYIGLFVLTKIICQDPQLVAALCRLFTAAWNYCRTYFSNEQMTLLREKNYIGAFRISAL